MVYRGHVENGVVMFDEPVALPEGTFVEVQEASQPPIPIEPTLRLATEADWKAALAEISTLDIDWDAYRQQRQFDRQHVHDHLP